MLLGLENRLLATLPAALYQKWTKHFALRELKKGQSLNLKGTHQEVYFPISCVIAIYSTNTLCRRTLVIPPILGGLRSRHHAAMASRCFGVIPPKAMFGR